MAQGFNMEWRSQQEWGWLLTTWLFLSGTGSGLFLLFEIFDLPSSFALLSLSTIVLGGVVLLLELGSPLRAWRGVSRLGTSWLSRGALSVALFVLFGFLFIAPKLTAFSWLPWEAGGVVARTLGWLAGLCALIITLYPGFFLAQNRSIPFWNTALLPVMFWCVALLGACGLSLLASSLLSAGLQGVEVAAGVLIVVNLFLVSIYLFTKSRSGGAAKESVRLLNTAPLNWTFWLGVVMVGMILPFLVVIAMPSAAVVGGAGMLIGTFLFRYCVLKAGVYVPPALISEGTKLTTRARPTSTQLQREYAAMAVHQAGGRG